MLAGKHPHRYAVRQPDPFPSRNCDELFARYFFYLHQPYRLVGADDGRTRLMGDTLGSPEVVEVRVAHQHVVSPFNV